jgi:hypothetical protein
VDVTIRVKSEPNELRVAKTVTVKPESPRVCSKNVINVEFDSKFINVHCWNYSKG